MKIFSLITLITVLISVSVYHEVLTQNHQFEEVSGSFPPITLRDSTSSATIPLKGTTGINTESFRTFPYSSLVLVITATDSVDIDSVLLYQSLEGTNWIKSAPLFFKSGTNWSKISGIVASGVYCATVTNPGYPLDILPRSKIYIKFGSGNKKLTGNSTTAQVGVWNWR